MDQQAGHDHTEQGERTKLVDALRVADRAVGAASAKMLDAVDELARCSVVHAGPRAPRSGCKLAGYGRYAASEIAAALGISERAAEDRLALAWNLHTRLRATLAALRSGAINLAAARILADKTVHCDQATCSAIEAKVLPEAGQLSLAALAAQVRRSVLTTDPAAEESRRVAARRRRRVSLDTDANGMAWLSGYLDAASAGLAWATIDAQARSTRASLDAAGVAHDGLDALRADTFLSALTNTPPVTDDSGAEPGGARKVTGPDDKSPKDRGTRVVVNVTMPLSALLGLDDRPGEMDRVGPITAAQIRELITSGPTWIRRILTDPETGQFVSASDRVHRYRPTAALDRHVRMRDRRCRFPNCSRSATHADIDHTVPWPTGPTEDANLAVLCRRHHQYKTEEGWTVVRQRDHSMVWTSPCGQKYTTRPEPWDHPEDALHAATTAAEPHLARRRRGSTNRSRGSHTRRRPTRRHRQRQRRRAFNRRNPAWRVATGTRGKGRDA